MFNEWNDEILSSKKAEMVEYLEKIGTEIGEFVTNWDVSNRLAVVESKTYQILQSMRDDKIDWETAKDKMERYIEQVMAMFGDFEYLSSELEEVMNAMGELEFEY